jgi:hypothetical protein
MHKRHPAATVVAFLCLVLLLASLAARFWATDRGIRFTGPTHIAADSQQLYLFASDTLYHLSATGEFLAEYPAEVAGLTDSPIDLRIAGDGRLLIAGQQPAWLKSCETDDWDCEEVAFGDEFAATGKPERQFKVLVDTPEYSLLYTDSLGDSLWGLSGPDSEARKLLPDKTLAGPNDLAFDEQGHLWIADTDHRRIVEFLPASNGDFELGRAHSAMNELTREKRYYPMMLALGADGNWWITQAAEFSDRYADLVVYSPDDGAIEQITLPDSIFATDIVASGDDILVTDLEQFTVYRVNTSSHEVSIFGDERFAAAMSLLRQKNERYQRISQLAMAGVVIFGVLMVLAAIIATPGDKRWTPVPGVIDLDAAAQSVPRVRGIYWLKRNEKIDRSLKLLDILGTSFVILTICGGMALYGWMRMQAGANPGEEVQTKLNALAFVFLISGLLLAALLPLLRQSTKVMKRRLGTDGKQLYIRLNEGRELAVSPVELAYTNRAIFYRQYSMPLQTGKQHTLYEDGEVETWIAPLLRHAAKLSPFEGLKYQWKHSNPLLTWSLASGVILGLLLIFVSQLN